MARPRTEPAQARRNRILKAARALLIRKDYEDIVLDDVAQAAGLAKGTLYLYFKNKNGLISAVLTDMVCGLEDCLRKANEKDPLMNLRTIARLHLEFLDENHDFMTQILRQDPVLSHGRAAAPMLAAFNRHMGLLSQRVRKATEAGLLRPHDPHWGALHFMSLIRMQLVWKVLSGSKRPLKEKADEVMKLYLKGVGA
jgi:AcrR family transcriptional regulator